MQNDGMCTLLAVVLILIFMSSGMREWMRVVPVMGPHQPGDACTSAVCGRKSTTERETAVSARVSTAPESKGKEVETTNASNTHGTVYEGATDSHTLETAKKNLQMAYRSGAGRDQNTCRTDFVGRTQGIRTGFHSVLLEVEGRNNPNAKHTYTDAGKAKWIPFFMGPEHATQSESLKE